MLENTALMIWRSISSRAFASRLARIAALLPALVAMPHGAHAASSLELVAGSPLDFGALVVLGSGTKQIGPDGSITASGVVTVRGPREGPAEFTLTYRPGDRTRTALVQLVFAGIPQLSDNGTTGSLSNLISDLPGLTPFLINQVQIYRMPPCPPPACSVSFHVGGRLSLTGGAAGASFAFPLPISARLIAEL